MATVAQHLANLTSRLGAEIKAVRASLTGFLTKDYPVVTGGLTINNPEEWETCSLDFTHFNGFRAASFTTYYEDGYSSLALDMKNPVSGYTTQIMTVDGETGFCSFNKEISAPNHLTTMGGFVSGKTIADEIVLGSIFPKACQISATKSIAKAVTAATAETIFKIKNQTGNVEVGTIKFAPGAKTATITVSGFNSYIAASDFLYIEAPTTPDATLANISFLVRP